MDRRSTIFSLSPEAFQCIANELDLGDIFNLSTCSKRSFKLVKNTAVLFKSTRFDYSDKLSICMCSSQMIFTLSFHSNFTLYWYFARKRNRDYYDYEDKPPTSVEMDSGQCNQKTIVFREDRGNLFAVFGRRSNSVQDFLQLVKHISTLFSASADSLTIDPEFMVHLDAILSIPILKNCPEVCIDRSKISHDKIRRVLENFHCKKMKFDCLFDRYFNLPLKYSCESLSLNTSQVTNEHVNVFLHQWLRSECKKLVDLEIKASTIKKGDEQSGTYDDKCWLEPEKQETPEEKWDLKKIAHGLSSYVITYLKNKNVLVFQRETDGMELRLQIIYANYQSEAIIYLFKLSTCSKRSFNLVKNTAVLFESARYEYSAKLNIVMCKSQSAVFLRLKPNSTAHWYFAGKRKNDRYEYDDKPPTSVKMNSGQCNQKTIQFEERQGSSFVIFGLASDSVQDFLQFVEHISTLFSVPVGLAGISPAQAVHLESILSVTILKNCPEVWITNHGSGKISHDAMRRVLEGFNCKQVKLNCNIDRNFKLPLKYSCESLFLYTSQLTYEHVNVFLHQWIRSECKKPVDLEIKASTIRKEDEQRGTYDDKCWQETENPETQEEKWNLKKIAKGLTRYVITYLKNNNALVFQRETDGMELRLHIFYGQSESIIYLFDNQKDHWTRRRVAIANQ